MPDIPARLAQARSLLTANQALLLGVGADLPYLTGYEADPTERLTMLVVRPDAVATLVVPRLEAPRVTMVPGVFDVAVWDETEDPVSLVAERLRGSTNALIGDTTWSVFLLRLQETVPDVAFRSASALMRELRVRKDGEEIELLRAAAAAADRVMSRLDGERFSGRTERAIAHRTLEMLVEEGHDRADFAIVASGPNGASPHHAPGDRVIADGDTVVVDIGGRRRGYRSDTTRTFQVGEPSSPVGEAFDVLLAAQQAGVTAALAGVTAEEVDRETRSVISAAGWGEYFVHRTGHGIGMETHEHPYLTAGNREVLEPGMAFSIEPGIYVPGEFGMRIEDIVVVTDDGPDVLNRSPRGLHRVA